MIDEPIKLYVGKLPEKGFRHTFYNILCTNKWYYYGWNGWVEIAEERIIDYIPPYYYAQEVKIELVKKDEQ